MSLFGGTGVQNFTNERMKTCYQATFLKAEQIRKTCGNLFSLFVPQYRQYRAILERNKGARMPLPPGIPSLIITRIITI